MFGARQTKRESDYTVVIFSFTIHYYAVLFFVPGSFRTVGEKKQTIVVVHRNRAQGYRFAEYYYYIRNVRIRRPPVVPFRRPYCHTRYTRVTCWEIIPSGFYDKAISFTFAVTKHTRARPRRTCETNHKMPLVITHFYYIMRNTHGVRIVIMYTQVDAGPTGGFERERPTQWTYYFKPGRVVAA